MRTVQVQYSIMQVMYVLPFFFKIILLQKQITKVADWAEYYFPYSHHFKMRDQRFWLIFSNVWIESRLSVVVI